MKLTVNTPPPPPPPPSTYTLELTHAEASAVVTLLSFFPLAEVSSHANQIFSELISAGVTSIYSMRDLATRKLQYIYGIK